MSNATKNAFISNLTKVLTSLAEVALEEEVSFSEFAEVARFSYVRAAENVLQEEKHVSDSRISIVTGLHRKDVKRLRDYSVDSFSPEKSKTNRAIAVISAWTREGDYLNKNGEPLTLAYADEAPSLTTLIQAYSGDMPVRAVCKELERMGAIEEIDARWHLKVPAYVPNKSREAIFGFLGEDTSHLIETIQHNLKNSPNKRRFQRSVAYDELSVESVELFQSFASERAMDLLKELDTWLSSREKHDKLERKKQPLLPKRKAGMGMYFFEDLPADESDGDAQ